MDTNGIAETVDASVPDMLDHFFRTYDTVLMKKEIFQKRTFLSGQRKGKSIDTGLSCTGIKADTSALQTYVLLDKFPSCQTSDPCLQLFKMKRLCEIVIGTEIKPFNLVLDLSSGREDQNGSGSIGFPKLAQDFQPINAWKVQIKKDEIIIFHQT